MVVFFQLFAIYFSPFYQQINKYYSREKSKDCINHRKKKKKGKTYDTNIVVISIEIIRVRIHVISFVRYESSNEVGRPGSISIPYSKVYLCIRRREWKRSRHDLLDCRTTYRHGEPINQQRSHAVNNVFTLLENQSRIKSCI